MTEHDPLCPMHGKPFSRHCECELIARVRIEERTNAGIRVDHIIEEDVDFDVDLPMYAKQMLWDAATGDPEDSDVPFYGKEVLYGMREGRNLAYARAIRILEDLFEKSHDVSLSDAIHAIKAEKA